MASFDFDVIIIGSGAGGARSSPATRPASRRKSSSTTRPGSHITDWAHEMAPYYDLCNRMFGVMPSPCMETDPDRGPAIDPLPTDEVREVVGEIEVKVGDFGGS